MNIREALKQNGQMKSKTFWVSGFYLLVLFLCLWSLARQDDLSFGRRPWQNLVKTVQDFTRPSFIKVWTGDENFEYKNDDGVVLRTENQKELEKKFLKSLGRAVWMTFKIATLGSALACVMGFLLSWPAARKLKFPKPLFFLANGILNFLRSIHSLVFGLMLVGIVGLGPMAGILAIALHSTGTYGKLFAESIDSLDLLEAEALRLSGAGPIQTFFHAIWPELLPQFLSTHLYVWEYNIRDSAVLGLVGAGGMGLLLSDAVSLFQWQRLATLLLCLFILVSGFSFISNKIRQDILA
ncbi:phosphonate ABC transporter, permease protein PhnE [Bacteriovorax stolpii]|uniref:Phosphonate ABC transporter, permease protein PhnE n=1 Tax=Bacteriovorax stolpii TaxID=960 RepID=A0A2K9NUC3_BACTC|nr:phosphonate ABC transporter, permease protein PhnE [Bacteriovorax stolpii]AUN99121.1 phosphonate ABC transporter, permease protein PhnE [Bacteriovorax stolpii]QDK40898.1 phosphonate ABC transporter, permease protein PhnE [Bacteriovorax stolpii]TDP55347.1 phosphonate ABC transporter permease subunit PhnE [Bacteriovorax stolpii]